MRMKCYISMRFFSLIAVLGATLALSDVSAVADIAEASDIVTVPEIASLLNAANLLPETTSQCMKLVKSQQCGAANCHWCNAIKMKGADLEPSGCVDTFYGNILQSTGRYYCDFEDQSVTHACNSIKKESECAKRSGMCAWCDHPKGFGGCFGAKKQVKMINGYKQFCKVKEEKEPNVVRQ